MHLVTMKQVRSKSSHLKFLFTIKTNLGDAIAASSATNKTFATHQNVRQTLTWPQATSTAPPARITVIEVYLDTVRDSFDLF